MTNQLFGSAFALSRVSLRFLVFIRLSSSLRGSIRCPHSLVKPSIIRMYSPGLNFAHTRAPTCEGDDI